MDVDGILKGIYRFKSGEQGAVPAQILASGVAVPWAVEAQQILASEWNVRADVWSATSWNELRREAVDVERHNLAPGGRAARPRPYRGSHPVPRARSGRRRLDAERRRPIARWVPGTSSRGALPTMTSVAPTMTGARPRPRSANQRDIRPLPVARLQRGHAEHGDGRERHAARQRDARRPTLVIMAPWRSGEPTIIMQVSGDARCRPLVVHGAHPVHVLQV
ncbi:hypothetical protein SALBM135S_03100 [Streptomyces alboniger]